MTEGISHEGCEDYEGTRAPFVWGKAERAGTILPGEEEAQELLSEHQGALMSQSTGTCCPGRLCSFPPGGSQKLSGYGLEQPGLGDQAWAGAAVPDDFQRFLSTSAIPWKSVSNFYSPQAYFGENDYIVFISPYFLLSRKALENSSFLFCAHILCQFSFWAWFIICLVPCFSSAWDEWSHWVLKF